MRNRLIVCALLAPAAALAAAAQAAAPNGRIGYLRPLGGNNPPYGYTLQAACSVNGVVTGGAGTGRVTA